MQIAHRGNTQMRRELNLEVSIPNQCLKLKAARPLLICKHSSDIVSWLRGDVGDLVSLCGYVCLHTNHRATVSLFQVPKNKATSPVWS